MFHRTVLNVECTNLDPFFCDENLLSFLLCDNCKGDISVIEGVMGYYDGTGASGIENSTYSVANAIKSPVVLVIDAKGASSSLAAVVEGFAHYLPQSRIKGVIFNRMSPMNYKYICSILQRRSQCSVIPLGYIPPLPEDCVIPSRHLGLITANEISDITAKLDKTADICSSTIDIDGLLALSQTAEDLEYTEPEVPSFDRVNIAVARDNAFCFYYGETFRLLEKMGAELSFFSPLKNEPVPPESDGLLLGGGYPELYSETLEKNETAKQSVAGCVLSGMPAVAECGGFQYLGKTIDGRKMCGVIDTESFPAGKLVRFGYVALTSEKDGIFGKAGMALRAHEFHYWDSTVNGDSFTAVKPNGKTWKCAVTSNTLYAGYPHLYLWSCIDAAKHFYEKCLEYKENKNDNHRSERN
jgi:cobyrinic acid a,c-diamide synthase